MNIKLLLGLLFLVSLTAFAQDKKWSVEANYPIGLDTNYSIDDGTFDAAVRYRFINTPIAQLGIDVNGGINIHRPTGFDSDAFDTNTYFFQPKVFAEFNLPFLSKLRPSVGAGYSIVNFDYKGSAFASMQNNDNTHGGFNFDLGLSYDITKRFFLQTKYDFIALKIKGTTTGNGVPVDFTLDENIKRFKVGIGFRF